MTHKMQPSPIREAFYEARAQLSKSADESWARRDNKPDCIVACLFCRILGHLKAVEVLYACDFEIEANTVLRSCLETLFWMGAIIKDPKTIDLMVKDHELSRREKIKIILTGHVADLDASTRKLLEDVRAEPKSPKDKRSSVPNIAVKAGMGDFYLIYKVLSDASAHPSLKSINRHVIKGPDNTMDKLSVLVTDPDWDGVFNLGCNIIAMTKERLNQGYSLSKADWEVELHKMVIADNNLKT